ncbi:Ctr copper transporter [Dillenia turbinata]|uniref:Copper transport protein n=1 Tax=Dillenia turbinata TaxID=194707 RepID=A0AAN8WA17_9MAGN
MMHMTFYWGINVTLLFDFWSTSSLLSYCLTLLACFLFSAFYQFLEDLRLRFKFPSQSQSSPSITTPLLLRHRYRSFNKLIVVALFAINSAIGYLLMLAVMSFNGGVFVAIVLGLSVGYWRFRFRDEEEEVVPVAVAASTNDTCACS